MRIGDYNLKLRSVCPEVHDVMDLDGGYAGYLRLDHKVFRAYTSDGEVVYVSNTEGDGVFEEDERNYHLENGVIAIAKYYREN